MPEWWSKFAYKRGRLHRTAAVERGERVVSIGILIALILHIGVFGSGMELRDARDYPIALNDIFRSWQFFRSRVENSKKHQVYFKKRCWLWRVFFANSAGSCKIRSWMTACPIKRFKRLRKYNMARWEHSQIALWCDTCTNMVNWRLNYSRDAVKQAVRLFPKFQTFHPLQ